MRVRGVIGQSQAELLRDLACLTVPDRNDRLRHLAMVGLASMNGLTQRCGGECQGVVTDGPVRRASNVNDEPIVFDLRMTAAHKELIADLDPVPSRLRGERLRVLAGIGINSLNKTYQVEVALTESRERVSREDEPESQPGKSKAMADLVGRMSMDFG